MKPTERIIFQSKFIKKPKKGQICKVHFPDKTHKFGIVQRVETREKKQNETRYIRERLVLAHTEKTPELTDCDYILESCKVRFLKSRK